MKTLPSGHPLPFPLFPIYFLLKYSQRASTQKPPLIAFPHFIWTPFKVTPPDQNCDDSHSPTFTPHWIKAVHILHSGQSPIKNPIYIEPVSRRIVWEPSIFCSSAKETQLWSPASVVLRAGFSQPLPLCSFYAISFSLWRLPRMAWAYQNSIPATQFRFSLASFIIRASIFAYHQALPSALELSLSKSIIEFKISE